MKVYCVTVDVGPVLPVAPVLPVGPVTVEGAPVGPVKPVGPVEPVEPVGPVTAEGAPVAPVGPTPLGPVDPVDPVGPVEPAPPPPGPVGPVGPSWPSCPRGPRGPRSVMIPSPSSGTRLPIFLISATGSTLRRLQVFSQNPEKFAGRFDRYDAWLACAIGRRSRLRPQREGCGSGCRKLHRTSSVSCGS